MANATGITSNQRETMKYMLPLLALALLLPSAAHADTFFLKESDGTRHGPFSLEDKSVIKLQGRSYTVVREAGKQDPVTEKLKSFVVSDLQFQEASLEEVLNVLATISKELDTHANTGVSMVLMKPKGAGADPERDPFGDVFAAPGRGKAPGITLRLREATLLQALNLACELADCTHAVENGVVVVRPKPKANAPAK